MGGASGSAIEVNIQAKELSRTMRVSRLFKTRIPTESDEKDLTSMTEKTQGRLNEASNGPNQ
jgi:hypothetical protein